MKYRSHRYDINRPKLGYNNYKVCQYDIACMY